MTSLYTRIPKKNTFNISTKCFKGLKKPILLSYLRNIPRQYKQSIGQDLRLVYSISKLSVAMVRTLVRTQSGPHTSEIFRPLLKLSPASAQRYRASLFISYSWPVFSLYLRPFLLLQQYSDISPFERSATLPGYRVPRVYSPGIRHSFRLYIAAFRPSRQPLFFLMQ